MAAAARQMKPPCEVVELSSDEEEPDALMLKGRKRASGRQNTPPFAISAFNSSTAPNSIRSIPKDLPPHPSLPDDVFTFGSVSGPPLSTFNHHYPLSQALLPSPNLSVHPRSNQSLSALNDDTPMRQAAKRRRLNLFADTSSAMGEPTSNRSSSHPAPELGSEPEPRLESSSPRRTYQSTGKNTRLKKLQTALGFSDDDLFNFEVAAGGEDDLLERLEEVEAEKARDRLFPKWKMKDRRREQTALGRERSERTSVWEPLHDIFEDMPQRLESFEGAGGTHETTHKARKTSSPNSARAALRERSSNVSSGSSDLIAPQLTKRPKAKPPGKAWQESLAKGLGEIEEGEYMDVSKQPDILDLSEFFDDGLDESLPHLEPTANAGNAIQNWRSSPRPNPREENNGRTHGVSAASSRKTSATVSGKRRVSVVSLGSDPIVMTSSPKAAKIPKRTTGDICDLGIDDEPDIPNSLNGARADLVTANNDKRQGISPRVPRNDDDVVENECELLEEDSEKENVFLSESTAQLLARISAKSKAKPRHGGSTERIKEIGAIPKRSGLSRTTSTQSANYESISDSQSKSRKSVAPKRPRLNSAEREVQKQEKERERARKVEEKARSKEEKEEQKRLEKDQKAKEKKIAADLAEANRARLDRKVSTPEMIVDLPKSMQGTSVCTQVAPFLSDLNVEWTTYDSVIPDVIKFRRKVTARWNDTLGYWELAEPTIEPERHLVCLIPGKDFAKMASQEHGLENHVTKIAREYPGSQPIYLIEGIDALIRKSRNSTNRAYTAAVRSHLAEIQGSQGQRRAGSKTNEIVDEDTIEDGLLRLQVVHNVLVHHTNSSVETAQWIAIFTQHISSIPYKYASLSSLQILSRVQIYCYNDTYPPPSSLLPPTNLNY